MAANAKRMVVRAQAVRKSRPAMGRSIRLLPEICSMLLVCAPSAYAQKAPDPPSAATHAFVLRSPNGDRIDNYFWLRDDSRTRPEVIDYLRAENAYYVAMTAKTGELENALYNEIVGRVKQDDSTVPAKSGHFYYYNRFDEGKQYPVYARRHAGVANVEQVMLDGTALSRGHNYFQIANLNVSPNEALLAYAEDTVGRRQFTIHFRNLSSGRKLADELPNTSGATVWADDNKTVFYVENDPVTLLTTRVKKHLLGTDTANDIVVYTENDHSFYIGIARTGDRKYIVIDEQSTLSSETRYIPANQPTAQFKVLATREKEIEYHADHIRNQWIVRTNWLAKNFRILEAADGCIGDKNRWNEIIPGSDDVFISDVALFKEHLVIGERGDGLQRIRIRAWDKSRDYFVESDIPDYIAKIGDNHEQDTTTLRYEFSSLVTPDTIYDLDMRTGKRTVRKRDMVLGGYDPSKYVAERVWSPARDGTKVPVSLLYRIGLKRDGTAPLYQYGYGAGGYTADPRFSSARFSLIDRGFVYAIAHVRGGGELGRAWYEGGKLFNKANTFTDFIDVTHFLVAQGYVAKDKAFAEGRSAGGLLMGAIANMAPQDYRAIVAHVPFVDIVTTMSDESIPLTTNEFNEWGNPKVAAYYDYMMTYSPYDNVRAQAYPALLVTAGLWDSQVQYYEPAKWVAKLRATKTDKNPLLLKVNMDAGHAGNSGRFLRSREVAEEFAFVLDQLSNVVGR